MYKGPAIGLYGWGKFRSFMKEQKAELALDYTGDQMEMIRVYHHPQHVTIVQEATTIGSSELELRLLGDGKPFVAVQTIIKDEALKYRAGKFR